MAEKTVASFKELKAAVEDADTNVIILSANVTFESGVKIPTIKKTLTLDGNGFTVIDMNSSAASSTLYVPTGYGTGNVTVKNVVWSGRNYYGIVCVYDDTANAGVTVSLQNVKYNGPQAIYNRYGTTVVQDCDFTIEKNGASSAAQEFCEANRVIFKGKTEIVAQSSSTAVMWFAFAGAELTVDDNAVLNVSAPNTYLIYSDTAAKPKLTFRQSSSTVISVKNGLFYASGAGAHIASSCTIEQNASLSVVSSANNGVPLFKCSGDFTLMSGGSLFLTQPQSGSAPLMYFSAATNVNFESPKNVALYNNGGKLFSFAAGAVVVLSANQVNYWTKSKTPYSSAGGFDDVPATAAFKQNGTDISIRQTIAQSTVTDTTSDVAEGDGGYPLSAANFDLTKATTLSAGNLPLSINPINDLSSVVTGSSDVGAAIELVREGKTYSSVADSNGSYAVEIGENPTAGENVSVRANKNFLTIGKSATVTGSVTVTKLPDIPFNAIGTPRYSAPLNRINPDWEIELTDTRIGGGQWALYVVTESELQSDGNVIEKAVTFTDDETSIVGAAPTLIANGVTDSAQKIYLSWDGAKGVLLNIASNEIYTKGKYVAKLRWYVEYD